MDNSFLIQAFAYYVVFVVTVVAHEAAHALAAMWLGDKTAYEGGQVSLDPVPHIRREPFGMVLVPILTLFLLRTGFPFGWASAPYDPRWARSFPRRAALMALAGPAANLLIALLAAVLIQILSRSGLLYDESIGGFGKGLRMFLGYFYFLNLVLGFFNLFPAPPLDGSSVIMLFMTERLARKYQDVVLRSNYAMLGFLLVFFFFWDVFFPVFLVVTALLLWGVEPLPEFLIRY